MKKLLGLCALALMMSACSGLSWRDLVDPILRDETRRIYRVVCESPEHVGADAFDHRLRLTVAGRDGLGRELACGIADLLLFVNDPSLAANLLNKRLVPGDRVKFSLVPTVPTDAGVPTAALQLEAPQVVVGFNVEQRINFGGLQK